MGGRFLVRVGGDFPIQRCSSGCCGFRGAPFLVSSQCLPAERTNVGGTYVFERKGRSKS